MAEGWAPMDTMLTADDPEHARYRKLVFEGLHRRPRYRRWCRAYHR